MATGILSSTTLAATTYTSVYSPTVANFGVVTLNVCNKNATAIEVRVAVATDPAIPTAGDYIEYGTEIATCWIHSSTFIQYSKRCHHEVKQDRTALL